MNLVSNRRYKSTEISMLPNLFFAIKNWRQKNFLDIEKNKKNYMSISKIYTFEIKSTNEKF